MLELLSIFTSELIFTFIVPGIFAGVALIIFGNFLPDVLAQYKIPAILGGIFLVLFFTYESGRYTEYTTAKIQKSKDEALIAELRTKSGEVTIETVIKYVEKIKYVDRIKEVPVNVYIPKEADAACRIDPTTESNIRMLINESNQGRVPGPAKGTNGGTKPTS